MMYNRLLKKLGLSKDESDIYLYLLEHGNSHLSEISQYTGINRPKLYNTLPHMQDMGLISSVLQGKRKHYTAENPKILFQYLENIKQDFHTFIPEIENIYSQNRNKPILKHITGKDGIRNIFLDIAHTLNVGDVFYRYSSRNNVEKNSISQTEYQKYKDMRDRKKLERMVITSDYLNSLKKKHLHKEVVVIPREVDLFEDNITKIIYAHKVAIIDYNTLECFIIESQTFAKFEQKLFKLLFTFMRQSGYSQ